MCRPKTEPSLVLNVQFWFLNCSEGEFGAGGCEHPDYASNASCVRGVCQLPLIYRHSRTRNGCGTYRQKRVEL